MSDDQAAVMAAALVQLGAARRALDSVEEALTEARNRIAEAAVGLARSIMIARRGRVYFDPHPPVADLVGVSHGGKHGFGRAPGQAYGNE
jgi:hypothetical protein